MSFLKRAIRDGIRQGINDAVGTAVKKAVEPKATEFVNKTALQFDQLTQTRSQPTTPATSSSLEGAFANLQRAAEGYATEMSRNIKLCPDCGETAGADQSFCPHCGAKLPEHTVAQGAVCPGCGKQNTVGTKYCDACGTKLPAAIEEEQAKLRKYAASQAEWQQKLPHYPVWDLGGTGITIEEQDMDSDGNPIYCAYVELEKNANGNALLRQYRDVLQEAGFRTAGQYPDICHLYKMIDSKCYHADTEHAFEAGMDQAMLYFNIAEPTGGFHYVKPAPKEPPTLKDVKEELKNLKNLKNRFKF